MAKFAWNGNLKAATDSDARHIKKNHGQGKRRGGKWIATFVDKTTKL
jgi:hypothetical protein